MPIAPDVRKRLEQDKVVWLTTITDSGAPAPNPVWFLVDGDDVLVFSEPTSRKVGNIGRRPAVTVHINSDPDGGDFYVLTGTATVRPGQAPSQVPGFLDKYHADIVGPLAMTVDEIDARYNAEIRIQVRSIRGV